MILQSVIISMEVLASLRNLSGLDLQKEMPHTVTVWYAIVKGSIHFKPRYGGFVVLASLDP